MIDVEMDTRTGAANRVVWGLGLSMLLASLGVSIANIALPAIGRDFGADFGQLKWVVVVYLGGLTLATIRAGRLGDRFGRYRVLRAGLIGFTAVSLACALAPSLWMLVVARAVQGLAAAVLMTLSVALVKEAAGAGKEGRAMGALASMGALGTALGPSLGGVLVANFGWRAVFWVMVPIGIGALVALRSVGDAGSDQAAQRPARLWVVLGQSHRLMPKLIANLLVGAVMMTTLIVGPFYLSLGLGLSEGTVGLVMSAGPLISVAGGVILGRLVDHWGAERVTTAGQVGLILGAIGLVLLPGVVGYLLAICFLTPGYQMFLTANNVAAVSGVPPTRRGTVSGILALSRNLGLMAGAWGIGAMFAAAVGASMDVAAATDIVRGMRLTFSLCAALMIAGLLVIQFGKVGRA